MLNERKKSSQAEENAVLLGHSRYGHWLALESNVEMDTKGRRRSFTFVRTRVISLSADNFP